MCRHLAYLGPPVSLAELVIDPPNSLYRQSWAPTDMRGGGSVNADGFGVGWYGTEAQPVRYRRNAPIWTDESLPGLARSIRSGAVLAALRNGSVGMPLSEQAVAPFTKGRWLFSHNGLITGWPGSVEKLAEQLPVSELLTMDAPMDSALLWLLVHNRLSDGETARESVASVVMDVAATAPESRLNLLLTDGEQIVATAWTHSLWVRRTADSVAVSSEPWAPDDGWEPVPDRSLLVATRTTLAVTPLDAPRYPEDLPMEGRQ
ncbi:MAG TPA: ergothioneine biosynthesis protein EgtC [Kribbella sp.]|nr:ergothioneine biosynthesis protein EgtC [Kribbella sp.]